MLHLHSPWQAQAAVPAQALQDPRLPHGTGGSLQGRQAQRELIMVLAPPLPPSRHWVRSRRRCSWALKLQPQQSSHLQEPPRRACQAADHP